MQSAGTGIRLFRSSWKLAEKCRNSTPALSIIDHGETVKKNPNILGAFGMRSFSQVAYSPATFIDNEEVTRRVMELLKSKPFIDPSKVSPTASFEDLELDILDSAELMMAVEEEFAVDIPNEDSDKMATTAQVIDYIAAHPQAK
ncbi:hypothetical protein AMTRI_Chr11g93940 [Amborella trichopoda]|uniref:Acyl carrier protein n=1 Tax=Amborella trichopoda TaxID=13333 RepID=W1PYL7_AMBTC|nr:uncharacterized protein LOC18441309 [Amborella trichopoda]XP_011625958.1 uncharacterized protein LOC18441309 [Amborella trichopoda]XP_011625959.1 uncharacterized protein LOC18441309 [Amborella trichopoda]ERN13071.1 hypothetical protein AMTR_s00040p00145090 [Amborella trichopoda]|eukprot:XP_006851490.1 uncharacterized protein LOC18441309 [Amborella trichopoda]